MAKTPFDGAPRDVQQFLTQNQSFGTSQRYRDAARAEFYYWSLQYDGLQSWNASAPVNQKKPRIIIPLFKTAIDTLTGFVWGGSRFPKIVVQPTRRDDDGLDSDDVGPELTADDAKDVNTFVNAMIANGKLDRTAVEYTRASLITTSCAVIAGVKGGNLYVKVEPGKHCTPYFDQDNPRALASLEILYQFEREESTGLQGPSVKCLYWYRRVIDAKNDTVYKPVKVQNGMFLPDWVADPNLSVKHNLGFCPVIWVRTLPVSTDAVDGQPVIDPALYSLLDRVNYTVSQRDRAVEYQQDPQIVTQGIPKSERGMFRKGSGQLWHLDKETKVDILELKGSGQDTASNHLLDLRSRFLEACRVVIIDPAFLKGTRDVSGQVLENLYAPMMSIAHDLRLDFGTDAFVDLMNICLRVCVTVTDRGDDVWIPGAQKITKLMKKAQLRGIWLPVPITLKYPMAFTPNAQDQQFKVATATQALAAGIIDKATARQYLSEDFEIVDIDAMGEQADQEKQDDMQAMADMMPVASAPKAPKPPAKPKAPSDG